MTTEMAATTLNASANERFSASNPSTSIGSSATPAMEDRVSPETMLMFDKNVVSRSYTSEGDAQSSCVPSDVRKPTGSILVALRSRLMLRCRASLSVAVRAGLTGVALGAVAIAQRNQRVGCGGLAVLKKWRVALRKASAESKAKPKGKGPASKRSKK